MPAAIRSPVDERALTALAQVSAAVESGAGLPEVARAAGRALNAGLAVIDSASNVLAVACASPEDERAVLAGGEDTETLDLCVGGDAAGELRLRPRGAGPGPEIARLVGALVALEAERARAPERASDAAVEDFLRALLERELTDRDHIVARGRELGADLADGGTVILLRAHPSQPVEGDWRARMLMLASRGARAVARDALAGPVPSPEDRSRGNGSGRDDAIVVVPGSGAERVGRAAAAIRQELESSLAGYTIVVARSRHAADAVDLHRAASEAMLAANVAEAQGAVELGFEETGAYRLLLSAVTDDPAELRSFHDETVAPLVAYDEQYETELLRTLETFLDADGSVATTAQRLYTHRHTIRYRLERVRDLTGLDVSSSDGRERLSLGLKAMRVLGIGRPAGPASEPGTEGGRVRREEKDR
ncbi:MAG TPA: helix-turn-helix domain-containing protein [Thermoleophilaceae bacterium]|nr:helix-turn-helix domain-containing protein [Thermoleophilaceae bacterium]